MSAYELVVVGCSHRTAPVEHREKLALDPAEIRDALRLANDDKILRETMILSTCNRTEFYALADDSARVEPYVRALVTRFKGSDRLGPASHVYLHRDREMVRHLFRVTAGLDAMVIGEVQILGQVKSAYEMAIAGGSAGLFLHRLMATALRAGRRAHAETGIGAGPVSFASASVTLTAKILGELTDKRILIVGAGETAALAARHFAEAGPAALTILNRTAERAQTLAAEVQGETARFEALDREIVRADVVVCATRAPDPLVTAGLVRGAMRERGGRAMVLVDLGLPRNVEPTVARLDDVFVYTLEGLQTIMEQNLARRRREMPRVEAIVEEETDRYFAWARSLEVTPVIRELRARFEAMREEELARYLSKFPEDQREHVEGLTRSLVNKLLHHPTTQIKALDADSVEGLVRLDTVRSLFALEGGSDGEPAGEPEVGLEAPDKRERPEPA